MRIWIKRIFAGLMLLTFLSVTTGFVIGYFYGDNVKAYIIGQLNKQLNTKIVVDPHNIQFSVLKNFPLASVEFKQVLTLDADPSNGKDTLFSAGVISLQFNLMDIFHKNYKIRVLSISDLVMKLEIDSDGKDNFHFWKTTGDTASGNFAFALEKINLRKISVFYTNKQKKLTCNFSIPKGGLSGRFTDEAYDLKTDLGINFTQVKSDEQVYIREKSAELKAEFSVNSKTRTYSIRKGAFKLAGLHFDLGGLVNYTDAVPVLDLQLKGREIDIRSVLSILPKVYKDKINDYSSEGNFHFDASIKGSYSSLELPVVKANFGIDKATIRNEKYGLELKSVKLKGEFTNLENSKLVIDEFSGKLNDGAINGSFGFRNFNNPEINLKMNADIDLGELQTLLKIDSIETIRGRASVDIVFKGRIPRNKEIRRIAEEDFKNASASGNLDLKDVRFRLKNSKHSYDSINGSFLFDNSDIIVNDFRGVVEGSDFSLKGLFRNILPWLFINKEDLSIEAKLKCRKLDLNELLVDEGKSTRRDTVYELRLPEHLHLDLNSSISTLHFKHFEAENLRGHVVLNDKRMIADPISFNTMDGKISGVGMIDGTKGKALVISCTASLNKVNITKLFSQLDNFGQATLTDKNLRGFLTAEIAYTSVWNSRLEPDLNKVNATGNIKIEKGELMNFAPLKAFSKFINVKELEDIRFETLENQIEIKNRTIFLPKMDLKNSALNLTCSGNHKFDNTIDYHIRLLMRELLAKKAGSAKKENDEFGKVEDDGQSKTLFISMTGTVDNPVFHYDKKGMFQKIKEDIKKEKHNLKEMLNEEFGWFKKDSTLGKNVLNAESKTHEKIKIKWDEGGKEQKKEDTDF